MKVSFVVPVYNVEKYVDKCLDSIYSQTVSDYEVIIVNDGSTDNSDIICKKYAELYPMKTKYFTKNNGGLVSAWKYGLKYVEGDYICFVDSDDFVADNYLEIFLENISSYDMICMNCTRYFDDGTEDRKKINQLTGEIDLVQYKNRVICDYGSSRKLISNSRWAKMIKTSLVINCAEICSEEISFGEDQQLILNILLQNPRVKMIDEYLYYYRFNNQSIVNVYKTDMFSKVKLLFRVLKNICIDKEVPRYEQQLAELFLVYSNEAIKNAFKGNHSYHEIKEIIFDSTYCESTLQADLSHAGKVDKCLSILGKKKSVCGIVMFLWVYRVFCFVEKEVF